MTNHRNAHTNSRRQSTTINARLSRSSGHDSDAEGHQRQPYRQLQPRRLSCPHSTGSVDVSNSSSSSKSNLRSRKKNEKSSRTTGKQQQQQRSQSVSRSVSVSNSTSTSSSIKNINNINKQRGPRLGGLNRGLSLKGSALFGGNNCHQQQDDLSEETCKTTDDLSSYSKKKKSQLTNKIDSAIIDSFDNMIKDCCSSNSKDSTEPINRIHLNVVITDLKNKTTKALQTKNKTIHDLQREIELLQQRNELLKDKLHSTEISHEETLKDLHTVERKYLLIKEKKVSNDSGTYTTVRTTVDECCGDYGDDHDNQGGVVQQVQVTPVEGGVTTGTNRTVTPITADGAGTADYEASYRTMSTLSDSNHYINNNNVSTNSLKRDEEDIGAYEEQQPFEKKSSTKVPYPRMSVLQQQEEENRTKSESYLSSFSLYHQKHNNSHNEVDYDPFDTYYHYQKKQNCEAGGFCDSEETKSTSTGTNGDYAGSGGDPFDTMKLTRQRVNSHNKKWQKSRRDINRRNSATTLTTNM